MGIASSRFQARSNILKEAKRAWNGLDDLSSISSWLEYFGTRFRFVTAVFYAPDPDSTILFSQELYSEGKHIDSAQTKGMPHPRPAPFLLLRKNTSLAVKYKAPMPSQPRHAGSTQEDLSPRTFHVRATSARSTSARSTSSRYRLSSMNETSTPLLPYLKAQSLLFLAWRLSIHLFHLR